MPIFIRSMQRVLAIAAVIIFVLAFASHASAASAKSLSFSAAASPNASSCASPPANFDPLKASKAQLLSYGLPLLQSGVDNATKASWANALRHAKHRVCNVKMINTHRYSQPLASLPQSCTGNCEEYLNWSGYIQDGSGFNEVQSYWVFSAYNGSKSPSGSLETSWVGIGGDGSNRNLFQAGTTDDPTNGYVFWWEAYPYNDQVDIAGIWPSPGYSVYVEVAYNSSTTADYVYVETVNDGNYFSANVHYGFAPNNQSAEWIDERSGCGGTNYHSLADFQNVKWSYGVAYNSGAVYLGGKKGIMYDYGYSKALTSPGSVNSSNHGFTDTWLANGTNKC